MRSFGVNRISIKDVLESPARKGGALYYHSDLQQQTHTFRFSYFIMS